MTNQLWADDQIDKLLQVMRDKYEAAQPRFTPITTALPAPGKAVVLRYINEYHNPTWGRFMWIPKGFTEDNGDYEGDDLDWIDDRPCWPEGWYEVDRYTEVAYRLQDDTKIIDWMAIEPALTPVPPKHVGRVLLVGPPPLQSLAKALEELGRRTDIVTIYRPEDLT